MLIYKKIEELKKQRNLTNKEIAIKMGYKSRQGYEYKINSKSLTIVDLYKLAKIFNVNINYFFEEETSIMEEPKLNYNKNYNKKYLELENRISELEERLREINYEMASAKKNYDEENTN